MILRRFYEGQKKLSTICAQNSTISTLFDRFHPVFPRTRSEVKKFYQQKYKQVFTAETDKQKCRSPENNGQRAEKIANGRQNSLTNPQNLLYYWGMQKRRTALASSLRP